MLIKNIYKILLILVIKLFFDILDIIKNKKIYRKYCQLNIINDILKKNGKNIYKYNIEYIKKIKKVVYSVIIGQYDKISNFNKQKGYNYFLFSDIYYKDTNWTIIPISKLIKKKKISKKKMTRYFKLFPHLFFKYYELSIYLDASYVIKGDLNELLLRALNPSFDLYFLQHYGGYKVFKEFSAVIHHKKDTKEIINKVKKRYIKEKFPDNLGLTENCIIIRKHNNKKIIKLMKFWWNEIKNYSYRDQLSLNYAIWKSHLHLKIYYLSKKFIKNYFSYRQHSNIIKF